MGSGRGGGGGGAEYQYFKVSRQQARAGGRDDTECTAGLQHCSTAVPALSGSGATSTPTSPSTDSEPRQRTRQDSQDSECTGTSSSI